MIRADQLLLDKDAVYVYFGDPAVANGYIQLMFQYPPRVTSDSRKANWQDMQDIPATTEPVVLFANSGAREMSLGFSYIYNNEPVVGGGGRWDVHTIQKQLRLIRSYFNNVKDTKSQRNLAIWCKFWGIGGQRWMTFRMLNADFKYSETLIYPAKSYDGKTITSSTNDPLTSTSVPSERFAFPFKTDVTMSLAVWTQGGVGDPKDDKKRNSVTTRLSFLEYGLTPEWY